MDTEKMTKVALKFTHSEVLGHGLSKVKES